MINAQCIELAKQAPQTWRLDINFRYKEYCEGWTATDTVATYTYSRQTSERASVVHVYSTFICAVEHMVCWTSVRCVYVTNDVARFLCCSYVYSLRSMHNLLIVCTCTDCTSHSGSPHNILHSTSYKRWQARR